MGIIIRGQLFLSAKFIIGTNMAPVPFAPNFNSTFTPYGTAQISSGIWGTSSYDPQFYNLILSDFGATAFPNEPNIIFDYYIERTNGDRSIISLTKSGILGPYSVTYSTYDTYLSDFNQFVYDVGFRVTGGFYTFSQYSWDSSQYFKIIYRRGYYDISPGVGNLRWIEPTYFIQKQNLDPCNVMDSNAVGDWFQIPNSHTYSSANFQVFYTGSKTSSNVNFDRIGYFTYSTPGYSRDTTNALLGPSLVWNIDRYNEFYTGILGHSISSPNIAIGLQLQKYNADNNIFVYRSVIFPENPPGYTVSEAGFYQCVSDINSYLSEYVGLKFEYATGSYTGSVASIGNRLSYDLVWDSRSEFTISSSKGYYDGPTYTPLPYYYFIQKSRNISPNFSNKENAINTWMQTNSFFAYDASTNFYPAGVVGRYYYGASGSYYDTYTELGLNLDFWEPNYGGIVGTYSYYYIFLNIGLTYGATSIPSPSNLNFILDIEASEFDNNNSLIRYYNDVLGLGPTSGYNIRSGTSLNKYIEDFNNFCGRVGLNMSPSFSVYEDTVISIDKSRYYWKKDNNFFITYKRGYYDDYGVLRWIDPRYFIQKKREYPTDYLGSNTLADWWQYSNIDYKGFSQSLIGSSFFITGDFKINANFDRIGYFTSSDAQRKMNAFLGDVDMWQSDFGYHEFYEANLGGATISYPNIAYNAKFVRYVGNQAYTVINTRLPSSTASGGGYGGGYTPSEDGFNQFISDFNEISTDYLGFRLIYATGSFTASKPTYDYIWDSRSVFLIHLDRAYYNSYLTFSTIVPRYFIQKGNFYLNYVPTQSDTDDNTVYFWFQTDTYEYYYNATYIDYIKGYNYSYTAPTTTTTTSTTTTTTTLSAQYDKASAQYDDSFIPYRAWDGQYSFIVDLPPADPNLVFRISITSSYYTSGVQTIGVRHVGGLTHGYTMSQSGLDQFISDFNQIANNVSFNLRLFPGSHYDNPFFFNYYHEWIWKYDNDFSIVISRGYVDDNYQIIWDSNNTRWHVVYPGFSGGYEPVPGITGMSVGFQPSYYGFTAGEFSEKYTPYSSKLSISNINPISSSGLVGIEYYRPDDTYSFVVKRMLLSEFADWEEFNYNYDINNIYTKQIQASFSSVFGSWEYYPYYIVTDNIDYGVFDPIYVTSSLTLEDVGFSRLFDQQTFTMSKYQYLILGVYATYSAFGINHTTDIDLYVENSLKTSVTMKLTT